MVKRIDTTMCHCLKICRSAENVAGFYDGKLQPSGVTAKQYFLLSQIADDGGCSVRQLATHTELDRSTLARTLKPLLKAGLVQDRKERGKRDSKLFLTERGEQAHKDATELWRQAQSDFEQKLGMEQVEALERALGTLQDL